MPTIFLTIGLPASGKSSWALGFAKSRPHVVTVSYDDVRKTLFNGQSPSDKHEKLVHITTKMTAQHSLQMGFDVVIHNTSLNPAAQESWKSFADANHVKLEIKDFRHVSPDTCISRDKLRDYPKRVGRAVIETMALKAGLLKFSEKPIVICDVDGTLADHEGIRSPYDESLVHMDKPHDTIVRWVRNLVHVEEPEYQIIVVSGRTTKCAISTENWLSSRITYERLFMRNIGDRRPDVVVKQEILDAILKVVSKEQIAFVIDDRPCVVEMWRKNGLHCIPARGAVEPF